MAELTEITETSIVTKYNVKVDKWPGWEFRVKKLCLADSTYRTLEIVKANYIQRNSYAEIISTMSFNVSYTEHCYEDEDNDDIVADLIMAFMDDLTDNIKNNILAPAK